MPLYEYRCNACGHLFEKIQKFSDPPVEVCPNCGERTVEKLLSSPAIQFKGTGWYITDYARKGAAGAEGGKNSGATESKESKPAADSKTTSSSDSGASSTSSSSSTSSGSSTTPSPPSSSKTS
jgi:putative FmdB family regulatory protein